MLIVHSGSLLLMRASPVRVLTAGAVVLAAHRYAVALTQATPSVTLPSGATVSGLFETNVAGNPIQVFRGIPYAEPPIGQKRWKQSTLKPLTTDLNATSYASICFGIPRPKTISSLYPPSEDCLFLNIFSPAGTTEYSKLPVMVWIHGGAFLAGGSNSEEGSNLIAAANEQLVVVSINYRLGVFGFFSNSELLREGDGANFGLRDQEIAFEWVKRYIQYFGGDPENVTAIGESAGSMSIALHAISRDGNQQLFKRAIMQSGSYSVTHDTVTPTDQEDQTAVMAQAVGCDGNDPTNVLGCLRHADAAAVFAVSPSLQWKPTVDGVYMKDLPFLRLLVGKMKRVPTIIGTNRDEGWFFTNEVAEASQFDPLVHARFARLTENEFTRLADLYPASAFLTPHHRIGEIFGDSVFVCTSELFALIHATGPSSKGDDNGDDDRVVESSVDALLEHSSEPVVSTHKAEDTPLYQYYFNFMSNESGYPLVIHTKDIAFVFNQVDELPTDDQETTTVVGHFQQYWTNFATTGSPNGQQQHGDAETANVVWPTYDATKQQLVIQPTLEIETNSVRIPGHIERCEFWWDVETRIATEVAFV